MKEEVKLLKKDKEDLEDEIRKLIIKFKSRHDWVDIVNIHVYDYAEFSEGDCINVRVDLQIR
jgi:hypothetical protein